jgi:DNA-binding XRE family transcriptional regulator
MPREKNWTPSFPRSSTEHFGERCNMAKKKPARTFGQMLREKRITKGFSLRKFAELVGVSPTYLSQVEQDNVDPPTADRVKRMAELLLQQGLGHLPPVRRSWAVRSSVVPPMSSRAIGVRRSSSTSKSSGPPRTTTVKTRSNGVSEATYAPLSTTRLVCACFASFIVRFLVSFQPLGTVSKSIRQL